MYELYEKLKEAYGRSTMNNNLFEKEVNKIKWDARFEEDDEYYFVKEFKKGDKTIFFTLSTQSLNPFDMKWKPVVMYAGCMFSFEVGM